MATVTGITVAKAQEIEDSSVVSGHVTDGVLYLTTKGGAEVNAGPINPISASDAWPIGSIFMATVSTNPATLLGGGTWVRWGQGRVPVSLDSTQTEFDTSEETGGEKTHTLTAAEMPAHNHDITDPGHHHDTNWGNFQGDLVAGSGLYFAKASEEPTSNSANATTGVSTEDSGGSTAHNNLPPYITCYFWKRTA